LGDNQISDVGPLARMPNLKILQIERNHIRDISPLAGFQNLGKQYRGVDSRNFDRTRVRRTGTGRRTLSLGAQHDLDLIGNPLNEEAYRVYIPALRAKKCRCSLRYGAKRRREGPPRLKRTLKRRLINLDRR
jgi:Leucine-rich repeat (LRR) protein